MIKQVVKPVKKTAKAVKVEVKEVNRTIPNVIGKQTFYFGKAPYNPRAPHNIDSWERMCIHLDKAGDKGVAGTVLAEELVVNGKHPDKTHFDFVSYLERRGALSTKLVS